MDKRKQILDAALKLFVEFGFHGTPTSKIAQEAGVANGTLFHYFATKDELIVALYSETKKEMSRYISENYTLTADVKESLKGQYLASLYWGLEHKAEFRFIQQFKSSPFISQVVHQELAEEFKLYFDMIQKGIEEKTIKPIPFELLDALIVSQIFGVNQYLLANDFSKSKQHQIISDSFDLLWDMLS